MSSITTSTSSQKRRKLTEKEEEEEKTENHAKKKSRTTSTSTSTSTSTASSISPSPSTSVGRVEVYSRRDKINKSQYHYYNVTSKSKDSCSVFSPFFLGPVDVIPFEDDMVYTSQNMENAWQYLKLFKQHAEDEKKWLSWATKGWESTSANRYPMGKGAKPMYSMWKGRKLGYIEARICIYAPLYVTCVLNSPAAKAQLENLQTLHQSGIDIALYDYDGYGYLHNNRSLLDVIYNPKRKMGHAFIIAGLITGDHFWETTYDEKLILSFSASTIK